MRSRILFQKLYVAIVLLVLLTIQVAIPVVNASDKVDGEVNTFGFNNKTEITNIVITELSGVAITSGTETSSLSRSTEFIIQFDVEDLDGFEHIDVYIALFNTDTNTAETDSGVLITAINSGVWDRGLVVRWFSPERSVYLSGLSASGPFAFDLTSGVGQSNFLVKSGTENIDPLTFNSGIADFKTTTAFNLTSGVTWVVADPTSAGADATLSGVVNVYDASGVVDSSGIRNIKYQVKIPFVMSKVAPSSGVWTVGVMVHDRLQKEVVGSKTGELADHYAFSAAYQNQWYGEVQIVGNSSINFTNVQAGSGFAISDQSGIASGIQVRFISNGTYQQQVQSDTTWTPATSVPNRPAFAYLVPNSGLERLTESDREILDQRGNRFALQARRIQIGSQSGILSFVGIIPAVISGDNPNFVIVETDAAVYRLATNQIPSGEPIPSRIGPIASAAGTTEAGVISIFEFQLRLSAVFQNTTYNGNITIGVSNENFSAGFINPS